MIKRAWEWVKTKTRWILISLGVITLVFGAEVVPVEMKWVVSYETVAFDTVDGDLDINEYAVAGDKEWYIREVPKNEGQFVTTTTEPVGKKLVLVAAQKDANNPDCTGCAYYSEFMGRDGKKVRIPYEGRYKDLGEVKNARQPKKTENVSLLNPNLVGAAIAFVTSTNATCSNCSSVSFTVTTSGSDRGIVFLMSMNDAGDADRFVTSSSYNGATLTPGIRQNDDGQNQTVVIEYLANPDTGSNTFAANFTSGISSGRATVASFSGVSQSAMLDASNGTSTTDNRTSTYSLVTVADNAWIVDGGVINSASGISCVPNSGQTEITDAGAGSFARACAGYEGPITPAGSQTVSWTCTGIGCGTTVDWQTAGISIAPETGGAPTSTPARRRNPPPFIVE